MAVSPSPTHGSFEIDAASLKEANELDLQRARSSVKGHSRLLSTRFVGFNSDCKVLGGVGRMAAQATRTTSTGSGQKFAWAHCRNVSGLPHEAEVMARATNGEFVP